MLKELFFHSFSWYNLLGQNEVIFRRSCLSSLLTYIFCIMTAVWDFRNPPFYWMISLALKLTCGETEKILFSIGRTWYARKNKGHTIVMHVFNEVLRRSWIKCLGYCFLKCILYWNNKQLRVKQNILWIKWITYSNVNRFIVKRVTYYPIIIWLASLRQDSGVYTLSHSSTYIY